MAALTITKIIHPVSRQAWRDWLTAHFETEKEVWVAIPKTDAPLDYNDIVEEALCFNWIDSTVKTIDERYRAQRMTPRKTKGKYSQLNIERINRLLDQNLIHPYFTAAMRTVGETPFVYAEDVIGAIKENAKAWAYFQKIPGAYKRIKLASIELARDDQELFNKRLTAFVKSCSNEKLLAPSAGMQKYY